MVDKRNKPKLFLYSSDSVRLLCGVVYRIMVVGVLDAVVGLASPFSCRSYYQLSLCISIFPRSETYLPAGCDKLDLVSSLHLGMAT